MMVKLASFMFGLLSPPACAFSRFLLITASHFIAFGLSCDEYLLASSRTSHLYSG